MVFQVSHEMFESYFQKMFKTGARRHACEHVGVHGREHSMLCVLCVSNACALHVCAFVWARERGWPSQPPPIPRCRADLFPRGLAARRRKKILPADREVSG